jgi:hypothetical protein
MTGKEWLNLGLYIAEKMLSSFRTEKILHQRFAFILTDAFDNFRPVIKELVIGKVIQRTGSPPFGIACTKNNLRDSRMDNGSHAHGTGLDRNI